MTSASRRIALAAVAIALVAAACGGSDPVGDAPSTIAEPEASPTHEMLEEGGEADTADDHDDPDLSDDTHDDTADHHDTDDTGSDGAQTRYDADVADAAQTITVEVVGGAPVAATSGWRWTSARW